MARMVDVQAVWDLMFTIALCLIGGMLFFHLLGVI